MIETVSEEELKEQRLFMRRVRAVVHVFDHPPLAYTHSYGCQMNSADGERLDGMLAEMGFGFTDSPERADLILYNTCAVRENAENRVFGNVGALKHLKEKKPDLVIAVCGCMVQQAHIAARMREKFPFVDLIFGTHALHEFPALLYAVYEKKKRVLRIEERDGVIAEGLPVRRAGGVTASVPIMYGCNNFCSYCVVPMVRGRERSRGADEIVAEVRGLIDAGYKEILLLGQNVNSYGKGGAADFSALLRSLDSLDGEFWISFMTSHPKDCTRELIDTIAESRHISHHLHLPVQSGSDRVLKLMNRRYDTARYRSLVAYARERIPDLQLTTDLIVGFPGEMRDDFLETLVLVREIRFDSAYTFIYSRREGTKAAEMDDPIPEEEKGKWFRELLDVQGKAGEDAYRAYVGRTLRVLCGGRGRTDDALLTGKSRQNIIVDFAGGDELIGRFVDVRITKALNWALVGELI
ncbi:MAG: tRNA (N6-isopentenyl adenosine(37)-C2)-methylthiotransferase MiaB [Bacteroides sp.]|nr:tRNA (N6-isopentenyl adenosine(37)-C2)-methylthiotransferase MiaB [Eubacterium sp.]MCM1417346.1 tRNA (N6-isopentenyl adenosine(37)-C2)-methylthiotransferase MiaB [Roseburia sp.]MCM1461461.1 tRNA (N6-isopentenyl adenosine(37)-C2)-methylthiotransferase MiaB [Bacteroides sp.]